VGGFLGAGEKDVAIPFEEVKASKFNYDSDATTWVPDAKQETKKLRP
jgi:hypothetical protein